MVRLGYWFHEGNTGESKVTSIDVSVGFESKGGEKVTIPADVVVIVVGMGLATEFLKVSGIEVQKGEVIECVHVKGVEHLVVGES